MSQKARKAALAFGGLIAAGGIFSGIISLANRYLRTHGLLNPFSRFTLILILAAGLYFIYRRFASRLDRISKE